MSLEVDKIEIIFLIMLLENYFNFSFLCSRYPSRAQTCYIIAFGTGIRPIAKGFLIQPWPTRVFVAISIRWPRNISSTTREWSAIK